MIAPIVLIIEEKNVRAFCVIVNRRALSNTSNRPNFQVIVKGLVWFLASTTPLCNRPSGIFILAGFSGKNHWVGQISTGSA